MLDMTSRSAERSFRMGTTPEEMEEKMSEWTYPNVTDRQKFLDSSNGKVLFAVCERLMVQVTIRQRHFFLHRKK